ncbi:MAG: PDZ domain-containing protein [Desulfobacterales bacterium]|nr:PDZ domain-containing protein [Desulfobacterales bacterium]
MRKHNVEYEFCMSQFKPAIAGITVLLVFVLAWTIWHCNKVPRAGCFQLAAVTKPTAAPAPTISVKAKMTHPYWGNCNMCHVTIDAGQPISKVMAGPPISISQKMIHKYWGNCLLCHAVTDGFQAPPKANQQMANAAAFNNITAESIGLKIQTVTAALMNDLGLANEDGVLVLSVIPNSIADKAGFKQGDEIVRVGSLKLDTVNDFDTALNTSKPGSTLKMNIYRHKQSRNLLLTIPKNVTAAAAAFQAPIIQNQGTVNNIKGQNIIY